MRKNRHLDLYLVQRRLILQLRTIICNKYFDSFIYSYLPIVFMTLFNVAIILKLTLARFQNKTESSSLSKAAKGITVMLIGVSILFITCTLPYAIIYSIDSNLSTYVYAVQAILVYINHSVNIIVYSITNSQFNKELRKLIGCKGNKIDSTCSNQTSINWRFKGPVTKRRNI